MSEPITAALRKAIKAADVTRYALAKEAGVSQSVLSRFVSGECGITLVTADRLALALDLRLVPKGKR